MFGVAREQRGEKLECFELKIVDVLYEEAHYLRKKQLE